MGEHYGIGTYGLADELMLGGRRVTACTDRLLTPRIGAGDGHMEPTEPPDQRVGTNSVGCQAGLPHGQQPARGVLDSAARGPGGPMSGVRRAAAGLLGLLGVRRVTTALIIMSYNGLGGP